jgi:hypothetical protein
MADDGVLWFVEQWLSKRGLGAGISTHERLLLPRIELPADLSHTRVCSPR